MRPCVSADNFRVAVHTGCNFTGRTFMGLNQPQAGQIRQIERTFTAVVSLAFGTSFCNMAHGV